MFTWLYDRSFLDWVVVVGTVIMVVALLVVSSIKERKILPIALYVGSYLVLLVLQLGRLGAEPYQPNYTLPIEGLLTLALVALVWQYVRQHKGILRVTCTSAASVLVGVFVFGQYLRFKEYQIYPNGPAYSRQLCFSPQTIGWMTKNIPAGAVVLGSEGFYQVLAETNRYHWIPIPPANLYRVDSGYLTYRWGESDLIQKSRMAKSQWLVLLKCELGDPKFKDPGYGQFVSRLFDGFGTASIKRIASFRDGLVYRIE